MLPATSTTHTSVINSPNPRESAQVWFWDMTNVALVTDGAHHDHSALKFEIKVKCFSRRSLLIASIIEDLFGNFSF